MIVTLNDGREVDVWFSQHSDQPQCDDCDAHAELDDMTWELWWRWRNEADDA